MLGVGQPSVMSEGPAQIVDVPVAPLPWQRFNEVLAGEQADALEHTVTQGAAAACRSRRVERQLDRARRRRGRDAGLADCLHAWRGRGRTLGGDRGEPGVLPSDQAHPQPAARRGRRRRAARRGGARRLPRRRWTATSARLDALVRPGDIALLHDPQTAGLAGPLRDRGVRVVWRCHVGVDHPNARGA